MRTTVLLPLKKQGRLMCNPALFRQTDQLFTLFSGGNKKQGYARFFLKKSTVRCQARSAAALS